VFTRACKNIRQRDNVPEQITETNVTNDTQELLQRRSTNLVHFARELAQELCGESEADNGERWLDHARATAEILVLQHADPVAQAAAWLFGAEHQISVAQLLKALKPLGAEGEEVLRLIEAVRSVLRLRQVHQLSRDGQAGGLPAGGDQLESLRKMTLAIGQDLRVVLVRLASRLQTLRYHATIKVPASEAVCAETLDVLSPLANRLGLWQIKWELEDLAFRFKQPEQYKTIARALDERRSERLEFVEKIQAQVQGLLDDAGLHAQVSGRPKHIYSIAMKMRSKGLALERIMDLRALRVIVDDERACYEALARIHERWPSVEDEFDDYIARPKPNGYQSLHTVVIPPDGRPLEVQIRTAAMHRHAEFGVAAHWAYKEQSTGVASRDAPAADSNRLVFARQLLAWQQEIGEKLGEARSSSTALAAAEFIYVLTPEARIIELPIGSTPIDFAYSVHTGLGHRCRGARVDGQMVPLDRRLENGQTVEVITARGSAQVGPSRDWLNPELGYVRSHRARAKVRQWFNARDLERDAANGRGVIERIMQREGKTALAFDELATRLGFTDAAALFVAMARDELGPRAVEDALHLRNASVSRVQDETSGNEKPATRSRTGLGAPPEGTSSSVLVVGVDALMTQLAACCKPVPPDPIGGFVTRGRGVSVHRLQCPQFIRLRNTSPERTLSTDWGAMPTDGKARFAADVLVLAHDRPGLLRDVSDVFARSKLNVTAVSTQSKSGIAKMSFTLHVTDASALGQALHSIREVKGVHEAARRAGAGA
jgi:GTP pyrophosphokinase